ncbi:MAG: hypothetical protein LBQ05_01995 [Christensenellaceae bacterium]|jgi:protein arginine kinase|nr:hypothetical protein [Christensenellaceae bacterium]
MEPADLVLTTRIRLARNIENVPFVTNRKSLFMQIADKIKNSNKNYFIATAQNLDIKTREALYEQHLISKEFLDNIDNGIIVTRGDNKVSVMLGEEDHIRIQAITNNFDLDTPYQTAKVLAEQLEKHFKIARDNDLGYLTHHPANLGSGMRASVMIYLPALTEREKIKKTILSITKKIGNKITVRGVYGEGSSAESCIFQISNQDCIFMTDDEILSLVRATVYEISLAEFNEQQEWYTEKHDEIANEVFKAWGILTNALMLDSHETAKYLVLIKLGICLGILHFKNNKIIDDLFFVTKPNTLATQLKIAINDEKKRDKERAAKVREILLSSRI